MTSQICTPIKIFYLKQILHELSLRLSPEKCRNLVLSPCLLSQGVYRRSERTTYPYTKTRLERQHKEAGNYDAAQLELRLAEEGAMGEDGQSRPDSPSPFWLPWEILSVLIDEYFTTDEHSEVFMSKAPARQGILNLQSGDSG